MNDHFIVLINSNDDGEADDYIQTGTFCIVESTYTPPEGWSTLPPATQGNYIYRAEMIDTSHGIVTSCDVLDPIMQGDSGYNTNPITDTKGSDDSLDRLLSDMKDIIDCEKEIEHGRQ